MTGAEELEQVAGALVTSNTFRTLGAAPALGRDFRDGEEGGVILTDSFWRRRFGVDPNILGRNIARVPARASAGSGTPPLIGAMPPKFWMYYSGF